MGNPNNTLADDLIFAQRAFDEPFLLKEIRCMSRNFCGYDLSKLEGTLFELKLSDSDKGALNEIIQNSFKDKTDYAAFYSFMHQNGKVIRLLEKGSFDEKGGYFRILITVIPSQIVNKNARYLSVF